MEFFALLGNKVEIKTSSITIYDITYQQATKAARLLTWAQFHIIKPGGNNVQASFIVSKDEAARVFNLLRGNEPDPLLA